MTLKRFWKNVGLEENHGTLPDLCMEVKTHFTQDGLTVTLDKRPLKTPSGNTLLVPKRKRLAATLVANEWDIQDKVLKAHALPMVRLVYNNVPPFTFTSKLLDESGKPCDR